MNRAEIEAVIEFAWQVRHGGEGNIHAAISRLRALADDAPQQMPTAMNARWHDTPALGSPWREAVLKQCGYFGLSTFSEDPEKAMGQLRQAIEQQAKFEAVNSTYPQPDLAELICKATIRLNGAPENKPVGYACTPSGDIEHFRWDDPASLRAAIERLVGRIEK